MIRLVPLLVACALAACEAPREGNQSAASQPSGDADHAAALIDQQRTPTDAATATRDRLVADTLAQANELWTRQFARFGDPFRPAEAVLFVASAQSPCRSITQGDGPTFCRADSRIYISDASWDRLAAEMGGTVPIAQATVVAHEVGHVVQRQTGVYDKVMRAIEAAPAERGRLNAKLEFQADCYAGIWFREQTAARDPAALAAAERSRTINGDDYQQVRVRGWHDPAEISHGLSTERVAAFRRGLTRGNPDDCGFDI